MAWCWTNHSRPKYPDDIVAKIRNALRQMQVFNVPSEVFDKDTGWPESAAPTPKKMVLVDELQGAEVGWGADLRAGERMPKHIEKTLPGSITILARETVTLPSAFLDIHEVKVALLNGTLVKLPDDAKAPEAPAKSKAK